MKTARERGQLTPTVIGTPSRKASIPIAESSDPSLVAAAPRPTVMSAPDVGKKSSDVARRLKRPPPQTPTPTAPTAIPGVERRRIAVELCDLQKLSPVARSSVLQRAQQLVQGFIPERTGSRQAVLWGHRLQQEHSDLVSLTLELSRAPVLDGATRNIGRMTEILASIDIEALCDADGARGMLGQYFRRANRKIDTPEELDAARIELNQLVKLMGEALEQLLSLKATLESHSRRSDEIGDELEASALAAQFLSARLRETQCDVSECLLERSMSLTQTVAQIRGSTSMRQMQGDHPLRLIGAIQDVALVMVPGWLGSIAALNALRDGRRKPTPTEAGEIAHQLRNILRQLNP